jgi:diacylglycerol kinase (ATP)
MKRGWIAIVNPNAGGVRHGRLGADFLHRLGHCVETIVTTACPGGATQLAAEAALYSGLVAVGGDGTVAEVLRGMDRAAQRFAVVPAGTGNCLATDLGLVDGQKALLAIGRGQTRQIDLMEVSLRLKGGGTARHFLASTTGMGYATEVAVLAKQRLSRLHRHAYSVAAMLVRPRMRSVLVSIDGAAATRENVTGLIINNTRHIGAARSFPLAKIDDGQLDVYVLNAGWAMQCVHDIQMVAGFPLPGTPIPRRARSLDLSFDPPETVMLDGDLVEGVTDMEILCRPSAVTCMGAPGAGTD